VIEAYEKALENPKMKKHIKSFWRMDQHAWDF
jgi:hypothetical protein